MLLSELLLEAKDSKYADLEITKVTSKIEEIDSTCAFVFLNSVFRDNSFQLYEIVKRSPKIIITSSDIPFEFPHICVTNARRALSEMLYRFYFPHMKPPPIIGITGTNGKSSILQLLYHIFKDRYKIGLLGTQRIEIDGIPQQNAEYTMTTPDPEILYKALYDMKTSNCDYVFMEVSSHALALEKVAPLTFDLALFTGISEEHLDFHKTMQEYAQAKEKIFSQSKHAVLNTDDEIGQEYFRKMKIPKISLGIHGTDVRIENPIANFMRNTIFTYCHGREKHFVKTPLLAPHNAYNCAFALYVYEYLCNDISYAISRLSAVPQIKGRMECVLHAPSVFLDYAHTPTSMEYVLQYFYNNKNKEQKIIVLFGAGGDRDRNKRPGMAKVAEIYSDYCVVTTDNPRNEKQSQIFNDIRRGFQKKNHRFITNRENAISYAFSLCTTRDILILFGKGHEPYIIKKGTKTPYSELYSLFLARCRGGMYEN